MKIFLLVFFLCCIECSSAAVYYITPDHGNCTVNGTVLGPCYTLEQLINDDVLNEMSLELLLLPGTHLIPGNQTLILSNLSELAMSPFSEDQQPLIKCQSGAKIALKNILKLKIYSLNSVFCSLYENSELETSVNITKCVFESSVTDYAINIYQNAVLFQIAHFHSIMAQY